MLSIIIIAPEVISGKGYTFKSDIYSVGILMWEISSGQPPFISNYPEIIPGTPYI